MSAVTEIVSILVLAAVLFFLLHILIKKAREVIEQHRRDTVRVERDDDPFFLDYGYRWEWVMVFPILESQEEPNGYQIEFSLRNIVNRLHKAGLQTKLFFSVQKDKIFCKIRAPYERISQEAERIGFNVLADPEKLREECEQGRHSWKGFKVVDVNKVSIFGPYDYIYLKYLPQREDLMKLYKKKMRLSRPKSDGVFDNLDRLKLTLSIINARIVDGGCFLDIPKLVARKAILGMFPLHSHSKLVDLQQKWLLFFQLPWKQPIDQIKGYFGEKIGLYFVFLGHYTTWLIFPAFIGVLTWIDVALSQDDPSQAVVIPYFSVFIALWATLFLEFWKRKESTVAMRWGMTEYEENEQPRPQFKGVEKRSPIDSSPLLFFPMSEKRKLILESQSIIWTVISIVIGAVASIFVLKYFLTTGSVGSKLDIAGVSAGSIIASLVNAIQIQVMEVVYSKLALYLNDLENHSTNTEYEDALIAKTFMFQFVNSYASLFYISYIKSPSTGNVFGDCPPDGGCMIELQTALGTIFLTRLALGNITEIGIPWVTGMLRKKEETEGLQQNVDMSTCEKEFLDNEYHVMLGPFGDYAEMIIQFGYATLFVAAFPLAPFMSLVNNYIEIRVDSWKLCQQCRRPEPSGAQDIGTWYTILEIMSICSVITNGALFAFTSNQLNNYTWQTRVGYFVLFEHLVLLTKFGVAYFVNDVSYSVVVQLQRQKHLRAKVVDNKPDLDDNDDEFSSGAFQSQVLLDLTISGTDTDYFVDESDIVLDTPDDEGQNYDDNEELWFA